MQYNNEQDNTKIVSIQPKILNNEDPQKKINRLLNFLKLIWETQVGNTEEALLQFKLGLKKAKKIAAKRKSLRKRLIKKLLIRKRKLLKEDDLAQENTEKMGQEFLEYKKTLFRSMDNIL